MLDTLLSQANMCFHSLFIFMARFSVLWGQVRGDKETFDMVFHITAEKMFAAKNTPFKNHNSKCQFTEKCGGFWIPCHF